MQSRSHAKGLSSTAATAVALCCACLHAAETCQAHTGWKAGVASVVVTPPSPMPMAGAASSAPSTGKIHDLYAKALALEDAQGTRLVSVTMDVCMIPMELRQAMEEEVARRFQLPPESLLLNASHTHSGPETRPKRVVLYGFNPNEIRQVERYLVWLQGKLIEVIGEALEDLGPANLSFSRDQATFACNRRLKTKKGYRMAHDPDGPVDHDVPVLQVKGPDGKLRAVLFGYACHAVAFTNRNICGDYPGFAQRAIEQAQPGTVALFLAGCGGDQRPYPSGSLELAERYGQQLAEAVRRASASEAHPVRGPLRLALEQVALEFDAPPSREELLRQTKAMQGIPRRRAETLLKQLDETGTLRKTYPYYVHVARFGDDLILVALAWEVVVDYSLRLKKELDGPNVWVAAYSNEAFNYLPSLRVLQEGGYEAGGSLLGYTRAPARLAPSVERLVVEKVKELVEKTRSSSRDGRDPKATGPAER